MKQHQRCTCTTTKPYQDETIINIPFTRNSAKYLRYKIRKTNNLLVVWFSVESEIFRILDILCMSTMRRVHVYNLFLAFQVFHNGYSIFWEYFLVERTILLRLILDETMDMLGRSRLTFLSNEVSTNSIRRFAISDEQSSHVANRLQA